MIEPNKTDIFEDALFISMVAILVFILMETL